MRFRSFSLISRRILIVNVLPLAVLVIGIFYLDEYKERLIKSELVSLKTQIRIFAGALGEGNIGVASDGMGEVIPEVIRPMLRRLSKPTKIRARVFNRGFEKIADSRLLAGLSGNIQVKTLPSPKGGSLHSLLFEWLYDLSFSVIRSNQIPSKMSAKSINPRNNPLLQAALEGDVSTGKWIGEDGVLLLGAAAPIQRLKQVLGAVLIVSAADEIDNSVRAVRIDILKFFSIVLIVTILLSFYLSGTIASPIRRLAASADIVRKGQGNSDSIPDFRSRKDEIADLSASLREMTDSIWKRMEANERFAADVAHELKNPLTSLRSAVETVSRVNDRQKQAALMEIIQDDVTRLDRLITDISDASRLDAELAREQMVEVDIGVLLESLAHVYFTASGVSSENKFCPQLVFKNEGIPLIVLGNESRLVQVFENILNNARSFSPRGGTITFVLKQKSGLISVYIEDEGPGIPVESLKKVFERFYSERPENENFGKHSGLGLSISRQIIEAHGGAIHAENLYNQKNERIGARIAVQLPSRDF